MVYFLCCLPAGWSTLSAQDFRATQYSLREGLPQSKVACLLEDHRGALWAGTENGGVARFDGNTFRVLNTASGLPGNDIHALAEDPNHRIWIGTDKGLAISNGVTVQRLQHPQTPVLIHAIDVDREQGLVYAGADDSLHVYATSGRQAEHLTAIATSDPLLDFHRHEGELYAVGYRGVYKIQGDAQTLQIVQVVETPVRDVRRLFTLPDRRLCMASNGGGLAAIEAGVLVPIAAAPLNLLDALPTPVGVYLATRDQGLLLLDREGKCDRVVINGALPRERIAALLSDRWGNLWLGTTGGGLVKLSERTFKHLNLTFQGRSNVETIYAIAKSDSTHFVAAGTRGVYRVSQEKLVSDSIIGELGVKCLALLTDRSGNLWMGTEGDGLYLRTRDTLLHFTGREGLSDSYIRDLVEDHNGTIWAATLGGGLNKLSPRDVKKGLKSRGQAYTISYLRQTNGLATNRINCLAVDETGGVWYGGATGVVGAILPGGSTKHYGNTENLPREEVKSLAFDASGHLWIAYVTGQVFTIDPASEAVTAVGAVRHRPYALYAIAFDQRGHLWLGGADGAYRWVIDAERKVVDSEHFTVDDGFEALEVCSNAIYRGGDGNLYFGTLEGLSVKSPSEAAEQPAILPPTVSVVKPHLFYRPLRETALASFVGDWDIPADTLVLTHVQNNLSFEVEAVHLSYANNLLFSYLIEGQGSEWSPPSARNYITVANLAPGDYVLRARACAKGAHCAEATPVVLRVLVPYWMTDWFRYGVMALAVLLIALVFLLVLLVSRRRTKRRTERLRMERDLLALEQRALRLQMNPHFIFNTLNAIQGLIAREDPKSARQSLTRFSRLMREILQNSREEVITLEDEVATLRHYLELARFTHENCFDYSIDIGDDLLELEIPPLLLQPFVENAIIHGLLPQGGGLVRISAYRRDGSVELVIEDNGVGMNAAGGGREESGHHSAGLAVTRERLQVFAEGAGSIRFETPNGGGTRVVIEIQRVV